MARAESNSDSAWRTNRACRSRSWSVARSFDSLPSRSWSFLAKARLPSRRPIFLLLGFEAKLGRFGLLHAQFGGLDFHVGQLRFDFQPAFGLLELNGGGFQFQAAQLVAFQFGQPRAFFDLVAFLDQELPRADRPSWRRRRSRRRPARCGPCRRRFLGLAGPGRTCRLGWFVIGVRFQSGRANRAAKPPAERTTLPPRTEVPIQLSVGIVSLLFTHARCRSGGKHYPLWASIVL